VRGSAFELLDDVHAALASGSLKVLEPWADVIAWASAEPDSDCQVEVPSRDPILRMAGVEQMVGLRRTSIYRLRKRGDFPKPIPLAGRTIGWRESDLRAWIQARPPLKR
jgi:prophage regulatory protein